MPTKRTSGYLLKLRIDGPGVRSGSITVPDLLLICGAAQDAVSRQAEAMQGKLSLRPGPRTAKVHQECTLELFGKIGKGSSVLPFRLAKPQVNLPEMTTFGAEVVHTVARVVKEFATSRNGHGDYDPGVLDSLSTLGEIFDRKAISFIEWHVPRHNGHRPVKAVFNKAVRQRVVQRIKAPSHRPEAVEGILRMADFKELDQKCRIHPPIGQPIMCSFDKSKEAEVYASLLKPVRISGDAKINPNTGKIEEIHIQDIGVMEQLLVGAKDFFSGKSITELAEAQGVRPITDPKALVGGWPAEDNLDDFLEEIYAARS